MAHVLDPGRPTAMALTMLPCRIIAAALGVVCWTTGLCPAAVNVRDFGAAGDAIADDTEAIRQALLASPHVHFPDGVYVITEGIDLPPGARITGEASPALGTFPMRDDKERLVGGAAVRLPGTTLLFRGEASQSIQTPRDDRFSELRYAIKTSPDATFTIERLAIALDMIVYDAAGQRTNPATDGRSDCEVGLLVDDSHAGTVRDVQVFGHWSKAGMAVVSRGIGDNPDYNAFWNSSFMGDIGVALLGARGANGPGLSGTQFHGCRIFANDHHDRSSAQFGTAALYIDGQTAAVRADLNGHSFFGGCVRTYAPTAIILDHASNVSFHGVVFELPPPKSLSPDAKRRGGRIVGTTSTRGVYLFGCRMHDLGLDALGNQMNDAAVIAIPDRFGAASVNRSGDVVRLHASPGKGPFVQLTPIGDTTNSGSFLIGDAPPGD